MICDGEGDTLILEHVRPEWNGRRTRCIIADGGRTIQVDGNGVMHVADGLTGELLYSYELGGTVTTSPAVYRNMLVIRCQKDDREMLCGVRIGE